MFYFNARWVFKLPDLTQQPLPGSVVAASAIPSHTLKRRRLSKFQHLQHYLFDPQLYLKELTPERSANTILKLASYPWFPSDDVPDFDSSLHGKQKTWAEKFKGPLCEAWQSHEAYSSEEIASASAAAVNFQAELGTEAVILPGPLTSIATTDYSSEAEWIDAGIAAAKQIDLRVPVYATVALSDLLLRPTNPLSNPVLSTVIDQVSAREIDGVYLVPELAAEDGYSCGDLNTVQALLTLVDELVRGAKLRVVVGYCGSLWPLMAAAGAHIWVGGYYLGQRKLRMSEFEMEEGEIRMAFPRYHSLPLLGDISLKSDLDRIAKGGALARVLTKSEAARPLHQALAAGKRVEDVPSWLYAAQNIQAAAAHYLDVTARASAVMDSTNKRDRPAFVRKWLGQALEHIEALRKLGLKSSRGTEISLQEVWLRAFEGWDQLRHS